MTTAHLAVAAIILTASGLPAVEPTVRDLTVDVEILPAEFEFDLSSSEVSVSTDDSFDQALGFAIGGRYGLGWPGSPHTFVGGLQGIIGLYEYDPSSASYTNYGLRATLGYGYAISDRWTVLGELLAEFGIAEFEFGSSDAVDGTTLDGDYQRYGLQTRVAFEITDSWLTNAHLGYMFGSAELEGDGRTLDMDQSGFLLGIGCSYRFGGAPERLE